jgi:putative flippase GtrA
LSTRRQLPRFILVGAAAAAIHWLAAVGLMALALPPLVANVGGFCPAFAISYLGQRGWTFEATALPHRQTLPRFLLIALSGFAANSLLYALLLTWLPCPPQVLLGIVLLGVAGATFVAGRYWAFAYAR